MGRPPCCDKVGVKKGPWTPEEDIMLVSYVQENGPGNWRAVPNSTGLRRCSKSCRLRWTNYLRPGIKRGGFTDHEEKMIIQLQALLGNKWAAIASYLPERTDNDIKNYWNTHLKKKLKKLQTSSGCNQPDTNGLSDSISRGQWERMLQSGISTAKQALQDALSLENKTELCSSDQSLTTPSDGRQGFAYASSTENIARLLKGWVKNTPKIEEYSKCSSTCSHDQETRNPSIESKYGIGFDQFEKFETSNSDEFSRSGSPSLEIKSDPDGVLAPLSMLENWLLDDQGKDYLSNFSFDENSDLF